ncbi:heavy metal transporter [Pseudidiomarina salinarum]|uniref:Protein ApaG n=1 Tax=Pseudidiomarina salinarum TaxID=435908 RepID=A0A094ITC6_9GAMM|nr:Co2+/Mg2+ efflux protein ApaG [Pseudidiomarina salinarum]KFZ30367.1 heavy metal transporter [Pseudidiomarina salinarum]RUO68517.1 Co2+/Mg2+ efflux protein ApaG [Pseudidiomarina salinarum]
MNSIDISVTTQYLASQSVPADNQYVFAYTITITNNGTDSVQLIDRAWQITDAERKVTRVAGEGVVGQQPKLAPGETFSYTSGTVLATPLGSMQGHYGMIDSKGESFKVAIPSFRLAVPNILH